MTEAMETSDEKFVLVYEDSEGSVIEITPNTSDDSSSEEDEDAEPMDDYSFLVEVVRRLDILDALIKEEDERINRITEIINILQNEITALGRLAYGPNVNPFCPHGGPNLDIEYETDEPPN